MKREKRPDDTGKKKDREKGLLGAGLSATVGPWFKKQCEQAAMSLPDDHWIRRSEIFKRGFPAITTLLENASDELPLWLGAIVEQVMDGADAFQAVLDVSTKKGGSSAVTNNDDKWMKSFLNGVPKRLQDAPDKMAMRQQIEEEFKLLRELNNFFKEQSGTTATGSAQPAAPQKSLSEKMREHGSKVDGLTEKLQDAARRRRTY
jgi:hypothetical protein